jgi:hypothetical protein
MDTRGFTGTLCTLALAVGSVAAAADSTRDVAVADGSRRQEATGRQQAATAEVPEMPGFPIVLESDGEVSEWNARGVVLADLDGDGLGEVVFSSEPCAIWSCDEGQIRVWNHRGEMRTGFPVEVVGGAFFAPSVGDLDGDGMQEIVQVTIDEDLVARIVVVEPDGRIRQGFPVVAGVASIGDGATLADLDFDGRLEIVYASDYAVHVFDDDGAEWGGQGWPFALNTSSHGTIAIGDVDNDRAPELFVTEMDRMHLLEADGSEHDGWPVEIPDVRFDPISTAALADLDGDEHLEIVIAAWTPADAWGYDADTLVYVFHHDGSVMEGWPQRPEDALPPIPAEEPGGDPVPRHVWSFTPSPPVVTDLEGDGAPDIVFGSGTTAVASVIPVQSVVVAWDAAGQLKPGFPFISEDWSFGISMVTAVDADGDGRTEIFTDGGIDDAVTYEGYLYGLDATGQLLPGFPLRPHGTTNLNGAILGDVDSDGDLELGSVARDIRNNSVWIHLYDLDLGKAVTQGSWMTYHADNRRGGLYKRQYRGWRYVYAGGRRGGRR